MIRTTMGSESLLMLIKVINKGWVHYSGSSKNNSTGVSLSDIPFLVMLEEYIAMYVDWDLTLV